MQQSQKGNQFPSQDLMIIRSRSIITLCNSARYISHKHLRSALHQYDIGEAKGASFNLM
jgi:hypothetical protein